MSSLWTIIGIKFTMIKKVLWYILLMLLILALFFTFQIKSQKEADVKYVNGLLYVLDTEMDLLEHSKMTYPKDEYLEKKIIHLIGIKLLLLSSADVSIKELQGTPLKALNRFILFDKQYDISFKNLGSASLTIDDYLKKNEDEIMIEAKNREKFLQDPLKKEIKDKLGIRPRVKGMDEKSHQTLWVQQRVGI